MSERLTTESLSEARAAASALLAPGVTVADALRRLDAAEKDRLDSAVQLRRFFVALIALEGDADRLDLAAVDSKRLHELATKVLLVEGVKPRSSRFSYLHAELALAKARALFERGETWLALGDMQAARSYATRGAGDGIKARFALHSAICLLRLGHGKLAEEGLTLPVLGELPDTELARYWELKLKVLRWGQRDGEFESELGRGQKAGAAAAETLEWEKLAHLAQKGGRLEALAKATTRQGPLANPRRALTAMLWSYASPAPVPPGLVRVESLRRAHGLSERDPSAVSRLLSLVRVLEECQDTQIPLEHRLVRMDEAADGLTRHPDPEVELLARAAIAKRLKASQQPLRAAAVAESYRPMCRSLSADRHADLLGIEPSLIVKAWERFADGDEKPSGALLAGVPKSAPGRALELTRIGVGLLPKLLKRRFGDLFKDRSEKKALAQSDEVVRVLVERIGALKGPVVKLAQMTSVIHAALPEEIYQVIVRLREDSPGMAGDLSRRIMNDELGEETVAKRFVEWDEQPLASASVGQIHRARTDDGRDVVVKVQYPGLEQLIRSDMALLRLLVVPLYRVLFPSVDLKGLAQMVEDTVLHECDFRAEALAQENVRRRLADRPGLMVPAAYPELSTARVLTMDYVEGKRFSQFIHDASQEERNRLGVLLGDFLLTSCLSGEEFNADPHPGNYLFLADGRVALLDFGSMGKMPEGRLKGIKALIRGALQGDEPAFRAAFLELGYVAKMEGFDFQSEYENARKLLGPVLQPGPFRFTYDHFTEVFAYYGLASSNRKYLKFHPGDVPLWRFLIGLQVLFCELEAEADWYPIFAKALDL